MSFADNLRAARKSCDLTQKELAALLEIPYQTYNGYETKGHEPSFDLLVKIADYLGVTPNDLLQNERDDVKMEKQKAIIIFPDGQQVSTENFIVAHDGGNVGSQGTA